MTPPRRAAVLGRRLAARLAEDPARGYRTVTSAVRVAFAVGVALGVAAGFSLAYVSAAVLGVLPVRSLP